MNSISTPLNIRLLKVTFFAALVLLMEITFFHILHFIFDYYAATLVISFAALGIGLGAFAASRTTLSEQSLFRLACLGTTLCLYGGIFSIAYFPIVWISELAMAFCFFFPLLYISYVFKNHEGHRVYLFDMFGAFLGIMLAVGLFGILHSESILFLLCFAIPLTGFMVQLFSKGRRSRPLLFIFFIFTLSGGLFLVEQLRSDTFNFYDILQRLPEGRSFDLDKWKAFRFQKRYKRVATYDNIVGRIDLLRYQQKHLITVYNGYSNDTIWRTEGLLYKDLEERGLRWTTTDIRVLYGLVSRPRICIIGSAAEGIVKTVKELTPLDYIFPIEINPAIIRIMEKDFYEQSGKAYAGLKPIVGNALSILKTSRRVFDIITLINAHSTKTIGFQGAPDYLHTLESYGMYFDRLSDEGYLLLEERPMNRGGELALYRLLHTLWRALKSRGAKDPRNHIIIWDWMAGQAAHGPSKKYHWDYYVGLIVTKQPLLGERRDNATDWLLEFVESAKLAQRVRYFKGYHEGAEFKALFRMIAQSDFKQLEAERDFDASVVTLNRPFLQSATRSNGRIEEMLLLTGLVTLILWLFFTTLIARGGQRMAGALLNLYNLLIGAGYFLVEVILIQTYQNVFVSATSSLIYVLGFLLLSSGIGGFCSKRLKLWLAAPLLVLMLFAAFHVPNWLLSVEAPQSLTAFIGIVMICLCGFFMGVYFPRGLSWARDWGLGEKIPHFFAINAIAGSFAVVLALFLGLRLGYQETLTIAAGGYASAGLLEWFGASRRGRPGQ